VASTLEGPARDLLTQNANFAHVATLRKDGSIQGVVVWVDADEDGNVLLNSADGRAWPANVRRTGRATVTVANQDNPYEFVSVTGKLVQDTTEGADEHIDAMAKKYLGQDSYPFRQDGEKRIKLALQPERVTYNAPG